MQMTAINQTIHNSNHRQRLGPGFGGQKNLNLGEVEKKRAFNPIYFRLIPIKCFQFLNK